MAMSTHRPMGNNPEAANVGLAVAAVTQPLLAREFAAGPVKIFKSNEKRESACRTAPTTKLLPIANTYHVACTPP